MIRAWLNWLTEQVRIAVLDGIADATEAGGIELTPGQPHRLQLVLVPMLPAPVAESPEAAATNGHARRPAKARA